MPALSLIVCVYNERDLLRRLLDLAEGCYDDLVVVHDGPDMAGVKEVVKAYGGRFFENEKRGSLEAQSPFAWPLAKFDWIFRPDADEFPGEEMRQWLQDFRRAPEPNQDVSGYTCIWPLWNGRKVISKNVWTGRLFVFNRQRVRFFGMIEQGLVPDGRYEPTQLVLFHQPNRKSYGIGNVLLRKQAFRWREMIAKSLLGKPTDLPCWRWTDPKWPKDWEEIRKRPLRTAAQRLVIMTFRGLRAQWRADRRFYFEAALNGPIHHALICLKFWQERRRSPSASSSPPSESGPNR
ncbi:MAG TPA: glycosyltransferase [Verrucomicrobiae bacterium]|nr:glycosyltransferase [Verrucomicrobiae bacterium]